MRLDRKPGRPGFLAKSVTQIAVLTGDDNLGLATVHASFNVPGDGTQLIGKILTHLKL